MTLTRVHTQSPFALWITLLSMLSVHCKYQYPGPQCVVCLVMFSNLTAFLSPPFPSLE